MKKAALIIGLVSAQAFAIGAFAHAAPTDPLALPNKPHLDLKPGSASQTAEGTTAAPASKAAKAKPTKAEKQAAKKERSAERKQTIAEQNAPPQVGSAASPSGVKSPDSGPK